jgi:hypothetical protein
VPAINHNALTTFRPFCLKDDTQELFSAPMTDFLYTTSTPS